jgi:hypothetical protein
VIVVSVCSLKGGVGKTSVVLGLASAALARGVPTLVVDLDPQADATLSLDIAAGLTSDVATVLGASRRNMVKTTLVPSGWAPDGGALDVLPGSHKIAALDRPSGGERTLARLATAIGSLETVGLSWTLMDKELAELEAVTPADIQALARQYLRPDTAWKATVTSSQAAR